MSGMFPRILNSSVDNNRSASGAIIPNVLRAFLGHVDAAVRAVIICVVAAEIAFAPGSVVQAVILIERHPVLDEGRAAQHAVA